MGETSSRKASDMDGMETSLRRAWSTAAGGSDRYRSCAQFPYPCSRSTMLRCQAEDEVCSAPVLPDPREQAMANLFLIVAVSRQMRGKKTLFIEETPDQKQQHRRERGQPQYGRARAALPTK